MRLLSVDAGHTVILEDSNAGIQSARASGAFTIGLKQNLPNDYVQTGADAYAGDMAEVIKITKRWLTTL